MNAHAGAANEAALGGFFGLRTRPARRIEIVADVEEARYISRSRAFENSIELGRELVGREMAVRIEEHGTKMRQAVSKVGKP